MKLELKHLASYLPYGLKIHWEGSKDIYGITFRDETDFTEMLYPLSTLCFTMDHQKLDTLGWKPILRQLSDLTKEEYDTIFRTDIVTNIPYSSFDLESFSENIGALNLKLWQWDLIFKYHLDVFGLIEQKLAININPIK